MVDGECTACVALLLTTKGVGAAPLLSGDVVIRRYTLAWQEVPLLQHFLGTSIQFGCKLVSNLTGNLPSANGFATCWSASRGFGCEAGHTFQASGAASAATRVLALNIRSTVESIMITVVVLQPFAVTYK